MTEYKQKRDPNYRIENDILALLLHEKFYAFISRFIRKHPVKMEFPAAVYYDKNCRLHMLYNPEIFSQYTQEEKSAILMHEMNHAIFGHLTFRKMAEEKNRRLVNIAQDMAINSLIPNIPASKIMVDENGEPEKFPDGTPVEHFYFVPGKNQCKKYEVGLTAEKYYSMLKQNKDFENPLENLLQEMMDDHSLWDGDGDGEGDGKEKTDMDGNPIPSPGKGEEQETIAREEMKNIIRRAIKEVQNSGCLWGSVSQDMQKELFKIISNEIDWRVLFRYFLKSTIKAERHSSIRRINKKYPYIFAGIKKKRISNVLIASDQSGSVDDQLLQIFGGELTNLSKICAFWVLPFDSEVDEKNLYQWKKGKNLAFNRVCCGGTDFNAPTAFANANANRFDGLVILTDMYAPKPIPSKLKRIWITDKDGIEYNTHNDVSGNEMILAVKRPTKDER